MENGGKSKTLKNVRNVINQYNGRNIGFTVFYDGIATFNVHLNLDYHVYLGVCECLLVCVDVCVGV